MESIRQIAVQLPEGLQRFQLHLYANGLIGWSPEQHSSDAPHSPSSLIPGSDHADSWHEAQESSELAGPSNDSEQEDVESTEHAPSSDDDTAHTSNSAGDPSDHTPDSDDDDTAHTDEFDSDNDSDILIPRRPSGMTDEEQISEVSAFIVGDDTDDDLAEAALLAATQLVSSLADSSDYLEPEVIDILAELNVQLHSVDGGLKLEIDEGHDTRYVYIYGDDVEDADNDDDVDDADNTSQSQSGDEEAEDGVDIQLHTVFPHEASSDRGLDVRNRVECPVCLSGYSSNATMAALSCRHHVCSCCFNRLSRPKQCPICRARIHSHMEVII